MSKPSPSDLPTPVLNALLGEPTGCSLQREDIHPSWEEEIYGRNGIIGDGTPTNALRESNRLETKILYRQAGLGYWLNTPFALNFVLVAVLSVVATGLVLLIR